MWRYARELKRISDFPGLGHEHIPNKTDVLYDVEIKTNSLGLRANREYSLPKPKGIKRILFLGDSITLGWGVAYDGSYPQVLESLLNKNSKIKFEAVNTAVGNYNAINELAALKKFIYLEPDIIILGFYIDDIREIKYPSRIGCFLKKNSYLYAFIMDKLINLRYKGKDYYGDYYLKLYNNERFRNDLKRIINEIIEIANSKSIPLIFVNIPEFHRFDVYPFLKINRFIEDEILSGENIKYINLLTTFQNQPIPSIKLWVSAEDHHPNAKAHKIIAKRIYEELMKDGYLNE